MKNVHAMIMTLSLLVSSSVLANPGESELYSCSNDRGNIAMTIYETTVHNSDSKTGLAAPMEINGHNVQQEVQLIEGTGDKHALRVIKKTLRNESIAFLMFDGADYGYGSSVFTILNVLKRNRNGVQKFLGEMILPPFELQNGTKVITKRTKVLMTCKSSD